MLFLISSPAGILVRMAKWGVPVAVVLAVGSISVFAAYAGPFFGPSRCEQPEWTLSPTTVAPGRVVSIRAIDAPECDPRYGRDAEVQISLSDGRSHPLLDVRAPMSSAGAFEAELVIPEDAEPGDYFVSAIPYDIDNCFDTNARSSETITRTSCAALLKPLIVQAKSN